MPANARKDEMRCWDHLFYTITKLNRINRDMEYDELVLQCVRKYPVGVKQVDEHIKRFYIERGIINLSENGRLIPPDYEKVKQEKLKAEADEEAKRLGLEVTQ